jgi:MFS family permease
MPKGLRTYVVYSLVAGTGVFLYSGLIAPFGRSLGLAPATISLYYTVFSLVSVVTSFVGGLLGDRLGHKKVMTLGRLLWALQALLFAISRDWRLFILSAVVRGMVDLMVGPSMAMAGSLADDSHRATVFGVLAMVQSATGVLAPIVGGAIADHFGARAAFVAGIPLILVAASMIRTFPEPPGRQQARQGSLGPIIDALARPAGKVARLMLLFMVSNGVSNAILNLVMPLFVQDRFGVAYTGIGALGTASSLGTMATSILGGRLADKYGKGRTGATLLLLGAIPMIPLAFTTSISQIYLVFFLSSLFGNAASPGLQALVIESVPPEVRSSVAGVFHALFGVSYAASSAVMGQLYSMGQMFPFAVFYVNLFLSTVVILAVARATRAGEPVPVRAGTSPGRAEVHE